MKLPLLILIGTIAVISGCKSSTEPPTNRLGPSITVTSNWSPSLDGGGRWFNGADTGVWYDATLSFTLNNSSGSVKDVAYKLEFGLYKDGKFQPGGGELFFDTDSIFSGSMKVGASSTLDLTPTLGIGRKNAKDWSNPYGYRLTLTDIATNDTYATEGSFSGSTPGNRFHGVIYTTEASPDPLGVLDAPDDSDWSYKPTDAVYPLPLYPNPVSKMATIHWIIQSQGAEVTLSVNRTRRDSIYSFTTPALQAGEHAYGISFASMKSGMYRVYITGKSNGDIYKSYGDVIVFN